MKREINPDVLSMCCCSVEGHKNGRFQFISGDLFLQLFSIYFKNNLNLSDILLRWTLFAVSSSSSSSWVKTRGGRSCSGLYYCLGRWRCSSHGAWRAPSLSACNYREVTWFQHRGSSTAPVHSGDLSGPSPPRCVWHSGYPGRSLGGRISTSGRPERSAAQRSGAVHAFSTSSSGGGKRTAKSRDISSSGTIRDFSMASKSVGLIVLFHLLVLNVVSQSSAFPTPTASADGEWDVASAAQLTFTVAVLKCSCRKLFLWFAKKIFKAQKVHKTLFSAHTLPKINKKKTEKTARWTHCYSSLDIKKQVVYKLYTLYSPHTGFVGFYNVSFFVSVTPIQTCWLTQNI